MIYQYYPKEQSLFLLVTAQLDDINQLLNQASRPQAGAPGFF